MIALLKKIYRDGVGCDIKCGKCFGIFNNEMVEAVRQEIIDYEKYLGKAYEVYIAHKNAIKLTEIVKKLKG